MLFFISLLLLQEANGDILVDVVLTREIPALLHCDNGAQPSMKQELHCGSWQLLKDLRLACSHRQHPWDCLHLSELHQQMLNLSPIQKMLQGVTVLDTSSREQEVKK